MGVRTAADEHIHATKECITEAMYHIAEALNPHVYGGDMLSTSYKRNLADIMRVLLTLESRMKGEKQCEQSNVPS